MTQSLHTVQLQDWVGRIKAGDLTARDELLRSVCGRMTNLAEKMLRGFPTVRRWAETDDVLQDAMMRLLRALETVEITSTRDFFGLAATQIRRELVDLARRFQGPRNQAANYESRAGASSIHPPDGAPEGAPDFQQWTLFHEEVEKLPAEDREVVSLVFYHNWTQAQVAELFQVDVRTIRRKWQAALMRLSEALQGELPGSE